MIKGKSDLDLCCEAIAMSASGMSPGLWLSRYGSLCKIKLTGVRPQLRYDLLSTYRFYKAYVEDEDLKPDRIYKQ